MHHATGYFSSITFDVRKFNPSEEEFSSELSGDFCSAATNSCPTCSPNALLDMIGHHLHRVGPTDPCTLLLAPNSFKNHHGQIGANILQSSVNLDCSPRQNRATSCNVFDQPWALTKSANGHDDNHNSIQLVSESGFSRVRRVLGKSDLNFNSSLVQRSP